MSEYITHRAVYDDSARLALNSPEICDAFKLTLKKHWEIGGLGSVTRGGDRNSVNLLEVCRDNWASRKEGDGTEEKLAFLLGWRCHNTADRMWKPIYRTLQPEHYVEEREGVSDIRIYHDVIVFREVYDHGRLAPLTLAFLDFQMERHPASSAISVKRAEDLFGAMYQRTLLELQSFVQEEMEIDAWLDWVFKKIQPLYVDLTAYTEAYYNPNTDYLRRFIIEPNFYDRSDAIIRLARSIQLGEPDVGIDLQKALQSAKSESQYAQALEWGYRYLKVSSDFFEHKIDEATFSRLSDLDKPHKPKEIMDWINYLKEKARN